MNNVWSTNEVRLIVESYFTMLSCEITRKKYNKSAYARQLIPTLSNRTRQSVEFKCCNISAALRDKGLPYIKGYQPRGNYQNPIPEIIDAYISDNLDFKLLINATHHFPSDIDGVQSFITPESHVAHDVNLQTITKDIEADALENDNGLLEGKITSCYGKKYERKPENRKRAIDIHGTVCVACGFNFERVYGERGKDFIEIHHTKPLNTLDGNEQKVNPEADLIPVCSNCHRMIHRRHDSVLSIEELKNIIQVTKPSAFRV